MNQCCARRGGGQHSAEQSRAAGQWRTDTAPDAAQWHRFDTLLQSHSTPRIPTLLHLSSAPRAMSVLASPSGAAADFLQIRMHIPDAQHAAPTDEHAGTGADVTVGSSVDRASISYHSSQLSAPPRSQLLQGESLHFYLLMPPALLARHPWLQLPWGRKLIKQARKEREAKEDQERFERRREDTAGQEELTPEQLEQRSRAADALVLHRAHPCPHQLHIRLRVVGSEECSEARRQIREQSCTDEEGAYSTTHEHEHDVEEPRDDDDDDNDDDGQDIVHDPQANEERTDSDDEPDAGRRRASMGSATTTTDKSSSLSHSSSHRRKSGTAVSSTSSTHRPPHARPAFAFRKSTLSLPSASHARSTRHHPSKLAPGYSPSFHGHSRHASSSAAAGATKEAGSPWNHVQSDAHATSSVAAPPQVEYFYFEPSLDAATAAQAGDSNRGPWLVLHVTTCISILPAYLSSPASMPFEQACLSGSTVSGSEVLSPPMMQLLSLELDLVSPPAKHHQSLNHATLHLTNTGQFLLDNPVPGVVLTPSLTGGGSASAGTAGGYGYNNLRAFVAQNRALQVPHLIPPARSYVTVVEPLLLSSKSVCLGSAGGRGAGDSCDGVAAAVDSSPSADICIEFTLLNLSSRWTLCLHHLDFILNRSRIFLKILAPPPPAQPPAAAAFAPSSSPLSTAVSAGSAALPPLTLTSPTNGSTMMSPAQHSSGGGGGLPPSTPSSHHSHSRAEHRSVHYLPLGNFFPSSLDASALPTKLRPHEQLNLLCFLSAPTRAALTNLESLVRGLLAAGGSVSHPSFSLATTSLPYRTPYTLRYTVEGVGSQDAREAVVAQNKTIWRSVSVANTATTATAAAMTSRAVSVPRILQSPSAVSPSLTAQSILAPSSATPFSKLSLRLRVSASPVSLHVPFAVFVSVLNHHASLATNSLQIVVLPETHEVVRASREIARAEEEAAAAAGRRRGDEPFGSSISNQALQPFSPSSPAPPLLFSPHTPFSPNTPWLTRDASTAAHGDTQPDESPRTREMHFPFQAVGAAIDRRAHSTKHSGLPLPQHPISVHTGDTESAGSSTASGASATNAGAGLSLASMTRQDSSSGSGGEVLTTTLSHFLSNDTHDPSTSGPSSTALAPFSLVSSTATNLRDDHAASPQSPEAGRSSIVSSSSSSSTSSSLSVSSLVCLETCLSLGVIPPQSDRSVTLHYLALREGLLALSTMFLFDPTTQIYYKPMQQATVFAVKQ